MTKETLDKTYDPQAIETKLYQSWEDAGYFKAHTEADREAYCIMIPPPNITGSLHMGHGFNNTIMDTLIRYHRMRGHNTLWQAGTDHAGIATQMVVERQLQTEGKSRFDLGETVEQSRQAFLDRVWDWKQHSGNTITKQLRSMGASLDWSRERFTMDQGLSRAVNEVFVRLYDEGLIYRGKRLVNWDPVLHTAVSDLEVISEEEDGHLWHMRYPVKGSDQYLVVATTRPETMLGDTAVAVHPDDDRYKDLIGKTVVLPLVDREIPIIADDYVDPEFGSGCVKITPAHDFNDYEVGQRHDLPLINIFTVDACINDEAPKSYRGLDRYDARKQILKDLKKKDLLEKTDEHKLMVPRGDRSGVVVEPYLTDQWFVKTEALAKPAIAAVKNGDIKFVPDNWKNTYFEWMRNIQDWCISRQIWWGHRIPAWYDADGKIYVGRDEVEVRKKHKLGDDIKLEQDPDVLDTWFSSALWPFSTLGWPDKTEALQTFYPTNVLVTGFDIIFFWVARMIMMGLKFTGEVPFRQVYMHGLIRDAHGQKMSKSKGNVLDPLDLIHGIDLESLVSKRTSALMQPEMAAKIEKLTRKEFADGIPAFGTDALRFTFASLATTGRNINFDLQRIGGYRNFCNKLWNAARFVLMNTEGEDCGQDNNDVELSSADRWIRSRLQQVITEVEKAIAEYRIDLMAQTLYSVIWDEYCSWYVELTKTVLNDDNASAAAQRGTRQTLVRVLETLLRLLHPITPFITESIWLKVAPLAAVVGPTIMLQPYPEADSAVIDNDAVIEMQWLMDTVTGIRNIRGEMDISPAKKIAVALQNGTKTDRSYLDRHHDALMVLAKLDTIAWLNKGDAAPEAATTLVGKMKVLVSLAGLIDKDAEKQRLQKEIDKQQKELQKAKGKLSNKKFISKAPEDIVNQEKQRVAQFESAIADLSGQLEKIQALPD